MAVTKARAVKRIPIPPLKPGASRLQRAAHDGLTLLFEERGGYPATLSVPRIAEMVNARLKREAGYEYGAITKHVIERVLGRRKG